MKEPFSIGDGLEIYNCDICHHKKVLGRMKETTEKGKKEIWKKDNFCLYRLWWRNKILLISNLFLLPRVRLFHS